MKMVYCGYVGIFMLFILSFKWPDEGVLITEFADTQTLFGSDVPAPYIMFFGNAPDASGDGTLVFSGRLSNALGNIRVFDSGDGFLRLYATGNVQTSGQDSQFPIDERIRYQNQASTTTSTPTNRQMIILMLFDRLQQRIVNPELLLASRANNFPPTLRKLSFFNNFRAAQQVEIQSDVLEEAIVFTSTVTSYSRRDFEIPAGEYYLVLDWSDGRFFFNDVSRLFSIQLYVNGRLEYHRGALYFQEDNGFLELFPGHSDDADVIAVSLRSGKNILEIYLQDSKGFFSNYEFVIDG